MLDFRLYILDHICLYEVKNLYGLEPPRVQVNGLQPMVDVLCSWVFLCFHHSVQYYSVVSYNITFSRELSAAATLITFFMLVILSGYSLIFGPSIPQFV